MNFNHIEDIANPRDGKFDDNLKIDVKIRIYMENKINNWLSRASSS